MDIRDKLKIERWKKLERLDEIYPTVFTAFSEIKEEDAPRMWLLEAIAKMDMAMVRSLRMILKL